MTKRKHKVSGSIDAWVILIGLIFFTINISYLIFGDDIALLNPKGIIASEQLQLMVHSINIMLIIAVPTLLMLYFIAWKYRESNKNARRRTDVKNKKLTVLMIWTFPIVIFLILATIMWPATHKLAPQKSISNGRNRMTVQVVALRWKWLFIYPEEKIATVNFVQLPVHTPVEFELTADETPMSSFWIPHLGGQLYAMTGHVNRLNLLADKAGDHPGSTAEINGDGFSGMRFVARTSTTEDYNKWILDTKKTSSPLTQSEYQKLLTPSQNNAITFYSDVSDSLYATILAKYTSPHNQHMEHE